MSQFARSADWLRKLFIPSRTGWQPPGRVAEEVSLTQPYDGGGYPTWPVGQWFINTASAAAAAGDENLITLPENELMRILGLAVSISAGVIPSVGFQILLDSPRAVSISEIFVPTIVNQVQGVRHYCPILGPTHTLRVVWFGGDAATVVLARAYVARAPLGSVFYV